MSLASGRHAPPMHKGSSSVRPAWARDTVLVTFFLGQLLVVALLLAAGYGLYSPDHAHRHQHDDPVSQARSESRRSEGLQRGQQGSGHAATSSALTGNQLFGGVSTGGAAGGRSLTETVPPQRSRRWWRREDKQALAAQRMKQHQERQVQLQQEQMQMQQQHQLVMKPKAPDLRTLVVYVFSPTDPEYIKNLLYFVREGIRPDDGCDYVIVINQVGTEKASNEVASALAGRLPPNARTVLHGNECYDWGTLGWIMVNGIVDTGRYKYVVFMNGSIRGPFLPAYWPKDVHWTQIFTRRLNNHVKLVGPTISCEGIQPAGMPLRKNPHVQSFLVVTDQVGLAILLRAGTVFRCYNHIHLTMFHSELGASKAILDAGFGLDCLMLRYQGVDWQNRTNWRCNADESPYKESHYDGINVDPLEVMFVKVKDPLLELRYTSSIKATTYDRWSTAVVPASREVQSRTGRGIMPREVLSNAYKSMPAVFRPVIMTADGRSVTGALAPASPLPCLLAGFSRLLGAQALYIQAALALHCRSE
mmetsp:Transcript_3206/g.9295  ORF Transcript_3206/g.9295 Transcript_3206/m.9295 type:complete len:532 (-) Transcript_3206:1175-2770(-)